MARLFVTACAVLMELALFVRWTIALLVGESMLDLTVGEQVEQYQQAIVADSDLGQNDQQINVCTNNAETNLFEVEIRMGPVCAQQQGSSAYFTIPIPVRQQYVAFADQEEAKGKQFFYRKNRGSLFKFTINNGDFILSLLLRGKNSRVFVSRRNEALTDIKVSFTHMKRNEDKHEYIQIKLSSGFDINCKGHIRGRNNLSCFIRTDSPSDKAIPDNRQDFTNAKTYAVENVASIFKDSNYARILDYQSRAHALALNSHHRDASIIGCDEGIPSYITFGRKKTQLLYVKKLISANGNPVITPVLVTDHVTLPDTQNLIETETGRQPQTTPKRQDAPGPSRHVDTMPTQFWQPMEPSKPFHHQAHQLKRQHSVTEDVHLRLRHKRQAPFHRRDDSEPYDNKQGPVLPSAQTTGISANDQLALGKEVCDSNEGDSVDKDTTWALSKDKMWGCDPMNNLPSAYSELNNCNDSFDYDSD